MPSARAERYGAPPDASNSPRRCSSSVSVIKSIACWLSPRAIICTYTRRCWSRKKSSGRTFSIAVLSAQLSSKIAPRIERSASRLLGGGRSRVESEDGLLFLRETGRVVGTRSDREIFASVNSTFHLSVGARQPSKKTWQGGSLPLPNTVYLLR